MAIGAPDWQGLQWKTEVTVRPNQVWPTGKVVWQDIFDSPVHGFYEDLNGGAVILDTNYFFSRPTSLRLSTDNDNTNTTSIEKYFGPVATQKYGIEFALSISSAVLGEFTTEIRFWDGINLNTAGIKYILADNQWQYYDATGNYIDAGLASLDIEEDQDFWHRMKFTANFGTNKYIRLYFDDLEHDLTGLSFQETAQASGPLASVRFRIKPRLNSTQSVHLDNIVVTEED